MKLVDEQEEELYTCRIHKLTAHLRSKWEIYDKAHN